MEKRFQKGDILYKKAIRIGRRLSSFIRVVDIVEAFYLCEYVNEDGTPFKSADYPAGAECAIMIRSAHTNFKRKE